MLVDGCRHKSSIGFSTSNPHFWKVWIGSQKPSIGEGGRGQSFTKKIARGGRGQSFTKKIAWGVYTYILPIQKLSWYHIWFTKYWWKHIFLTPTYLYTEHHHLSMVQEILMLYLVHSERQGNHSNSGTFWTLMLSDAISRTPCIFHQTLHKCT